MKKYSQRICKIFIYLFVFFLKRLFSNNVKQIEWPANLNRWYHLFRLNNNSKKKNSLFLIHNSFVSVNIDDDIIVDDDVGDYDSNDNNKDADDNTDDDISEDDEKLRK